MTRPSRILSAGSVGRAAAELALIVAGVLIALGVDGAMERQRERRVARESLALIRNDLGQLVDQTAELERYNVVAQEAARTAYRALAAPGLVERRDETWLALVSLTGRRTARFPRAAYDELVGTGNLRALGDEALRADIVRFYETLARDEEVIGRNNEAFTDGLVNQLLIREGLLVPLPTAAGSNVVAVLDRASEDLLAFLPEGPSWEGRIWELPAGHPDRRALLSSIVTGARVAAAHRVMAEETRVQAEALMERIDETLGSAPSPIP